MTQEQFAEKAEVSTHYIALIETCNKYPKPEMLERLAKALRQLPLQLFSTTVVSNDALERLIRQGISDMKQAVREAVKETLAGETREQTPKRMSRLQNLGIVLQAALAVSRPTGYETCHFISVELAKLKFCKFRICQSNRRKTRLPQRR